MNGVRSSPIFHMRPCDLLLNRVFFSVTHTASDFHVELVSPLDFAMGRVLTTVRFILLKIILYF